jgi:hypothetical protein
VHATRLAAEFEKKEKESWDALMEELGVELIREIDLEAFTVVSPDFIPHLCKEGIATTLRALKENKKGKTVLAKLKKVKCSVVVKPDAKSSVKGDTLFYVHSAEPNGEDAHRVTTTDEDIYQQLKKSLKL